MPVETYTIKLKLSAILVVADHLKRGVYNDVKPILDDIGGQVTVQDQEAEQSDLQAQVKAAGLQLVQGGKAVP